ncbi:MAG: branched-chain amino acid ABC transporter permease [Solirubrobacteraceae bacterium]
MSDAREPGGRRRLPRWWPAAALIGILIFLSFYATDRGVLLSVLIVACIWAIAGLGWNVLAGFTGQLSFGHAAFFGTGAYTMALLTTKAGVSPWIGLVAGGVAGSLLAVLVGVPTFRLRGPYFALATLALAEALRRLVAWRVDFTGGNDGIILPIDTGLEAMFFEQNRPFAWLAIAFFVLAWGVTAWVRNSRLGYFMRAVRDDQDAAAAAGLNPLSIKLRATVVSAFITAVAGGLLARYLSGVAPDDYLGVYVSVQLLIFTFVGGIGTLSGPVVGAFLVVPLQHYLQITSGSQVSAQLAEVFFGAVLVAIILFYPKGIVPGVARLWQKLTGGSDERKPDEARPAAQPREEDEWRVPVR